MTSRPHFGLLPLAGLIGAVISTLLSGCAGPPGSMVVQGPPRGTIVYSKYFDGGDWLIFEKVGVSVVIDNDTPLSRQMFGSLAGTDSDAVGTVTVYFWNLTDTLIVADRIAVKLPEAELVTTKPFQIGPGPFARTRHNAGTCPFFAYATELKTKVTVEIDGETYEVPITASRRTTSEMKKYFGEGGLPPYPWFAEKFAQKPPAPE